MTPFTPSPDIAKLHVDDVLLFNEVRAAMFRIASDYRLPLRTVTPLPMPKSGMADRLGDCNASGAIRLVMRCTVDGKWVDAPMSPKEVWDTAAHELAHLKHLNHGPAFQEFNQELIRALDNLRGSVRPDAKEKLIDKLQKMQRQRDSEAAIGNSEAAEAFASKINEMLLKHELTESDIESRIIASEEPIIELPWAQAAYGVKKTGARSAWQERLARIVARANLCKFLIRTKSNDIWFVGTKPHAMVAEYTFGVLVAAADKMSFKAGWNFRVELRKKHGIGNQRSLAAHKHEAFGYRASWLDAFTARIAERFEEARKVAVQDAETVTPGSGSTALIRLDGQLARAQRYVDDKFAGRRSKASAISGRFGSNAAGHAAGRSAADRMVIGRKGVEGSSPNPKLLR